MMFGGEDDDDFIPGASSKLASLFGFGKAVDESYASLTYTAPKQPKKNRPESQGSQGGSQSSTQSAAQPPKLSIIIVKAVHTYKLYYPGSLFFLQHCMLLPQFQFPMENVLNESSTNPMKPAYNMMN